MYYIVEDGDTLPKIAEKIYGNRKKWKKILHANPDLIVLLPGVKLLIQFTPIQPEDLCSSPFQDFKTSAKLLK